MGRKTVGVAEIAENTYLVMDFSILQAEVNRYTMCESMYKNVFGYKLLADRIFKHSRKPVNLTKKQWKKLTEAGERMAVTHCKTKCPVRTFAETAAGELALIPETDDDDVEETTSTFIVLKRNLTCLGLLTIILTFAMVFTGLSNEIMRGGGIAAVHAQNGDFLKAGREVFVDGAGEFVTTFAGDDVDIDFDYNRAMDDFVMVVGFLVDHKSNMVSSNLHPLLGADPMVIYDSWLAERVNPRLFANGGDPKDIRDAVNDLVDGQFSAMIGQKGKFMVRNEAGFRALNKFARNVGGTTSQETYDVNPMVVEKIYGGTRKVLTRFAVHLGLNVAKEKVADSVLEKVENEIAKGEDSKFKKVVNLEKAGEAIPHVKKVADVFNKQANENRKKASEWMTFLIWNGFQVTMRSLGLIYKLLTNKLTMVDKVYTGFEVLFGSIILQNMICGVGLYSLALDTGNSKFIQQAIMQRKLINKILQKKAILIVSNGIKGVIDDVAFKGKSIKDAIWAEGLTTLAFLAGDGLTGYSINGNGVLKVVEAIADQS